MKIPFYISFFLSIVVGLIIASINSFTNWYDTGISVMFIFITSTIFGFLAAHKPWLIGISISLWVPIFNIVIHHGFESFAALIPGIIGAYSGYFFKSSLFHGSKKN